MTHLGSHFTDGETVVKQMQLHAQGIRGSEQGLRPIPGLTADI